MTPFLPGSHTCRQEETAKISRWVEKGGETIKEITERLREESLEEASRKQPKCHQKVKPSLTTRHATPRLAKMRRDAQG